MDNFTKRTLTGLFLSFLLFLLFLLNCWQFSFFLFLVLLLILVFEWPNFYKINSYKFWIIFLAYPSLPLASLAYLYCYNKILALLVFLISFSHDIGSYLIGKTLGKHKICPQISPKKTWAGFFGGYIFNLINIFLFFNFFSSKDYISLNFILLFAFLTSTFAFFGDLFESYLKRKANIKDSGNILPGHGGILDRIDSILFVTLIIILLKNKIINLIF